MDVTHKLNDLTLTSPKQVANVFWSILQAEPEIEQKKEHFWTIGLSTKNTIEFIELNTLGSLYETVVRPSEVFAMPIIKNVRAIIVGHNHPSGDPKPSMEDDKITKLLFKASLFLDIPLYDHVIISNQGSYFSYSESSKEWSEWQNRKAEWRTE